MFAGYCNDNLVGLLKLPLENKTIRHCLVGFIWTESNRTESHSCTRIDHTRKYQLAAAAAFVDHLIQPNVLLDEQFVCGRNRFEA